MQVFRSRDLKHLNIICVQIETVLSLIRANWMLWFVGAGYNLALLVAALLPRGGLSWNLGDLVLSVGDKQYEMLRYLNISYCLSPKFQDKPPRGNNAVTKRAKLD
jgi:hypothetical protein